MPCKCREYLHIRQSYVYEHYLKKNIGQDQNELLKIRAMYVMVCHAIHVDLDLRNSRGLAPHFTYTGPPLESGNGSRELWPRVGSDNKDRNTKSLFRFRPFE